MAEPIICVAYVHPGEVKTRWMESVIQLLGDFKIRLQGAESGPLISRARNMLLESFLETSASHILYTDTDVVFTPEDLRLLLEAEKPITGALYYGILGGNPNTTFPTALKYKDNHLQPLDQVPSVLSRVDAVGMGLTLVRREVVEALKPNHRTNYPFAEMAWKGHHHGEDSVFCLRAKEAGYETWLQPAARVGHIKDVIL